MTAATLTNGKPQRKQLSDEIDRLEKLLGDQCSRMDGIIDVLAAGLPGAVADACRDGARQAVKDAIIEIVRNPELRALIAPAQPTQAVAAPAPAPEPDKPSLWNRLKAKVAAIRTAILGGVTKVKEVVAVQCNAASETVAAIGKAAGEALNWKRVLWVSLCVGVVVGVLCLVVPQAVAAAVGAASATATSAALQTGCWLRRAARRFGLVS